MGILDPASLTPSQRFVRVPLSLSNFDRALSQRAYRRCNVVALGDSLVEGLIATTYRGSLVPSLQDQLRLAYPTSGQGGGGISGGLDTIAGAWANDGISGPQDCIPTTTGTVTKVTGATTNLGLGRRVAQLAAGASLTFPAVRCTGFDIEVMGVSSSTANFTWAVDGGSATTVSFADTRTTLTSGVSAAGTVLPVAAVPADWYPGVQIQLDLSGTQETVYVQSISGLNVTLKAGLANLHSSGATMAANGNGGYLTAVRGLTEGSHTVTITATQACSILAVDFFLNDETKGVHVYNAGHGGIRADQYVSTGNTDHWVQSIVARKPDAIFCNLLINDSGAQSPATVVTNMTALRLRVNTEMQARNYPIPSWVQTLPYEVYNATGRFGGQAWADYVAALHAWAYADTSVGGQSGIFILDGSRLMPRADAAATGYYDADLVHPTAAGALMLAKRWVQALPLNGTLAA